jgi:hypothetical protein
LKRIIRREVDVPHEINRFILNRFAELLTPIRPMFVNAGLAGRTFTETAPDMPWKRLNYSFDTKGAWIFDWDSDRDTGETIITYVSVEEGQRSLVDINYPYMRNLLKGVFKIRPTAEHALKMAPMMPLMIRYHNQAIDEAEKKFNVVLPKWRYVGDSKSAQTKIMELFLKPFFWKIIMKLKLWKLVGLK